MRNFCFAILSIVFCCSIFATQMINSNTQVGEPSAVLGGGFSHDNDQPVLPPCLNSGPITYSGSNTGIVDLSKLYDFSTVKSQLDIVVDMHVKFGMFSGDNRAEFMHYMENDELSESLIYRTDLSFKDTNYNIPTDESILNQIGQLWIDKPDQFRQVCGDSFVAQMHHGAYLYIVYQFHFLKHEDKQKFDDAFSASFSDFGKFNASMQQEMDQLHIQGNLHVFAYQVGGNTQYLGDIFKSPNPMEPSPISQCSFDNLKACDQVTAAIMNYVTTTGEHSFPNQLQLQPSDVIPQASANTGLEAVDYSHIVPIQTQSKLTPDIIAARDGLGDELMQTQNDLQRAQYLSDALQFPYVYDDFLQKLNAQIRNMQTNIEIIKDAGLTCFNDLGNCITAKQHADQTMIPLDPNALIPPVSINVTVTDVQGKFVNQQLFVATDDSTTPTDFLAIELKPTLGDDETEATVTISGANISIIQQDPTTGKILAIYTGKLASMNQYSGMVRYPSTGDVYNWAGALTSRQEQDAHADTK